MGERGRSRRRIPREGLLALTAVSLLASLGAGYGVIDTLDDASRSTSGPEEMTSLQAVAAPLVDARPADGPAAASRAATRPACTSAMTMPLRDAVAQTLMLGVTSPSRRQLDALLSGSVVGGLFLHGDSTAILTDGRMGRVAAATPRPLVSTDDEGGRVQRLRALAGDLPSARTQARTMSPAQVRELAADRGAELRRYGITMDLAPTVDLGGQPDSAVIGDRSYGADPARATRYARAFADGLRKAGVLPTLKHFPGHGRAIGDSHEGAATTPRAASLRTQDWAPYRKLAGSGTAVMMGHLTVPGLSTRGLPASLDPVLYQVLRTEIGFGGLVVTDELGMDAVPFALGKAVRKSLAAGADLALFLADPADVPSLLRGLVRDVRTGKLDETRVREAAGRVLAAKGCPAI